MGLLVHGLLKRPYCQRCGRLKRRQLVEYLIPAEGEPSFAATAKSSAIEARIQQLVKGGLPPEGNASRKLPAARAYVAVNYDACESCGEAELRADWIERRGKGVRVVRTRGYPVTDPSSAG